MSGDIRFYFELFKRRLPLMVVIFVLCTGLGIGVALTMPPKYSTSASLLVENAQLPDTLFTSTVQSQAARELEAIQLKLMTRSNLIDIASKFGVFPRDTGLSPDEIVNQMRARTEFDLSAGRDRATILRISFSHGNPQVAANVVNEFVTYVLRADVERRTGESGQTLEFFEQRVERLTQKLAEQSAEIVAYKEANNDALPEGLDFRLEREARLQERLNLNARDRSLLVEQRNRLVAAGPRSSESRNAPMTAQQREIDRLEVELRSKLAIYAPDSPTIKFLRKRIELLETGEIPGEGEQPEDGFQSMLELQLAGVDAELRSLDEDTAAIEAELVELRDAIERTPQVAIKLDELEREYGNTQTQYNEAVRARSTAEQGVDVETAAKGERVALIEPATVPDNPTSPNRKLIAAGGVFAGTALATAFFVLAELLNRTIRRPVDLMRGLGVQPLATIPYLEDESVRRRHRVLRTLFVIVALIAIPIGIWAVHTYYLPLDLLVEKVLGRMGL